MSGLKQELGLAQGIGLLSTSLLGTGVFAVPALAALVAGNNSLWAWPVLIILVFPIAIVFAILGRHYPSAGGVAHFVGMAFGSRLERVTGWLFLSVIPVGLPAALQIAAGFGQAMFGWHSWQLLLAELGTLALVWYIGTARCQFQCKSTNSYCRTYRRADCRYLVGGRYQTCEYPLPCARKYRTYRVICCVISDVLVFCRSGSICPSCLGI